MEHELNKLDILKIADDYYYHQRLPKCKKKVGDTEVETDKDDNKLFDRFKSNYPLVYEYMQEKYYEPMAFNWMLDSLLKVDIKTQIDMNTIIAGYLTEVHKIRTPTCTIDQAREKFEMYMDMISKRQYDAMCTRDIKLATRIFEETHKPEFKALVFDDKMKTLKEQFPEFVEHHLMVIDRMINHNEYHPAAFSEWLQYAYGMDSSIQLAAYYVTLTFKHTHEGKSLKSYNKFINRMKSTDRKFPCIDVSNLLTKKVVSVDTTASAVSVTSSQDITVTFTKNQLTAYQKLIIEQLKGNIRKSKYDARQEEKRKRVECEKLYTEEIKLMNEVFYKLKNNDASIADKTPTQRMDVLKKDHPEIADKHPIIFRLMVESGLYHPNAFYKYLRRMTEHRDPNIRGPDAFVEFQADYVGYCYQELDPRAPKAYIQAKRNEAHKILKEETKAFMDKYKEATAKFDAKDKEYQDQRKAELIQKLKNMAAIKKANAELEQKHGDANLNAEIKN